eukprot:Pompholyxophrys_punicea_v1_NODE_191_length_2874_cov_15.987230.p1 type:complete len:258 gc:universal NODE_191_length_2874_cov_15.987230:2420-1647(-)
MGRTQELSAFERGQIKQAFIDGVRPSTVAKQLGRSQSAVCRLMQRLRTGADIASPRRRSGRPRVTNERTDRFIVRQAEQDRFLTATQISQKVGVHERTVRNVLIGAGLKAKVAMKKPKINERQRLLRLAYAEDHFHYSPSFWEQVANKFIFCVIDDHAGLVQRREEVHAVPQRWACVGATSSRGSLRPALCAAHREAWRWFVDVLGLLFSARTRQHCPRGERSQVRQRRLLGYSPQPHDSVSFWDGIRGPVYFSPGQ